MLADWVEDLCAGLDGSAGNWELL